MHAFHHKSLELVNLDSWWAYLYIRYLHVCSKSKSHAMRLYWQKNRYSFSAHCSYKTYHFTEERQFPLISSKVTAGFTVPIQYSNIHYYYPPYIATLHQAVKKQNRSKVHISTFYFWCALLSFSPFTTTFLPFHSQKTRHTHMLACLHWRKHIGIICYKTMRMKNRSATATPHTPAYTTTVMIPFPPKRNIRFSFWRRYQQTTHSFIQPNMYLCM